MDDTASDAGHESLADSSYDIVSEADSAFDDVSSSSVPSRVDTPTHDSDDSDEDNEAPETTPDPKPFQVPAETMTDNKPKPMDDPAETPRASKSLDKNTSFAPVPIYAVADSLVDVRRPFRIAYHGPEKYKDAVMEKIGQALSISTDGTGGREQGSMYSIVQLSSFGDGKSSPDVTLIPSTDAKLIVYSCEFCAYKEQVTQGRENMHVAKKMELEQDIHAYPKRRASGIDLTVFMHEADTGWSTSAYDQSIIFSARAQRAGTHVLDISTEQQHSFHATFQTGHLRLNGTGQINTHVQYPWMPIDLRSFLDMDARELNLCLAFMQQKEPKTVASHTADVIHGVNKQLNPFYSTVLEHYKRVTADPQTVSKALLVSFILLASLLAGNLISTFLQPRSINTRDVYQPGSLRSIEAHPIVKVDPKASTSSEHTKPSDWLPSWEQRQPSKALQATTTGSTEKEDAVTDPTVELVPVKGLLYYLKMPSETGPRSRSAQPKVTASSAGQPVRVSTAKWNGTLFSLDFQPEDKSQIIDVFVGFEKSPRVYVFKIGPHSSWIDLARMQKIIDRQVIESGVAACLATTKELSEVGQRQLAVFRDHASDFASGSKVWLHAQAKAMQNTSSVTALSIRERFIARQAVLATKLGKTRKHISKEVQAYAQQFTQALSQNVVSLQMAKKDFTRRVQRNAVQARQDISTRMENVREQVKDKRDKGSREGVLKKARDRANSLRSKLSTCSH